MKGNFLSEILYKILFDLKKDMNDLKKIVVDLIDNDSELKKDFKPENEHIIKKLTTKWVRRKQPFSWVTDKHSNETDEHAIVMDRTQNPGAD